MSAHPDVSVVLPTYNRAGEIARRSSAPCTRLLRRTATSSSSSTTTRLTRRLTSWRNWRGNTRDAFAICSSRARAWRTRETREFRRPVATSSRSLTTTFAWHIIGSRRFGRLFAIGPISSVWVDASCPTGCARPRDWLTRTHWAPLALQDLGDEPMTLSLDNPRGLISANLTCRKELLERIGGFSPQFQRVKDGIGSLEDDEWMRRLWKRGERALYIPELVAYAAVPASRLTRKYPPAMASGHGRFYALLRADEMEQTSVGAVVGCPRSHVQVSHWRPAVLDRCCRPRPSRAGLHA